MTNKAFILKSWDEQINVFHHNLLKLKIRPGKNAVHDLRVAIKKIRSYLRLNKEITGTMISKEFGHLDLLFKTTGRQRDFEMSASLLSRYSRREKISATHFKKILQVDCRITRKWTKQEAQKFEKKCLQILTGDIYASFSPVRDEELVQKIKLLVTKILKKTGKLSTHLKKNVHEIRKMLKDPYYWLKSLPENSMVVEYRVKAFEKLLDNLGDWQDRFIFLNKLSRYKKEFAVKNDSEAGALKKFEETAKKEQADLFKKIKINLKELLFK
jgi:CHAD domain-containing protein